MTNADHNAVLALLNALSPGLNVHDGHVTASDPTSKVISADLPYVVFYAMPDDATPGDTLAGTSTSHLTQFQLTFVGETREQAMLAGERARTPLDRKRVTFPSGARFVRCRSEESQFVRRDDTWTRPGGEPLFFGVDRYAVLI